MSLYTDMLALEPDSLDAITNLAACYHQLGQIPAALSSYHRAIALATPDDTALLASRHEHLGRALLRLPDDAVDRERVVAVLSRALEYDPTNDVARHLLASQRQRGGEAHRQQQAGGVDDDRASACRGDGTRLGGLCEDNRDRGRSC